MSSRASLNKVLLIGNLTRDPELRYTPSGAGVCTFGLATNRVYTSSDGTKKEETEFHKVVAWNKLGELCSQLLKKGRKIYVEGRLSTRSWETPDGQNRSTTEVVIDDMRILDSRKEAGMEEYEAPAGVAAVAKAASDAPAEEAPKKEDKSGAEEPKSAKKAEVEEVDLDDLPF
ncbi:single-stranded DNA-binding protein [Candidatus Curtissbacteria bacterium]|nr:single-stranded DNA-binding protein [Candidatus Curtissbacteria bacterium]